jgi:hypothetical protein
LPILLTPIITEYALIAYRFHAHRLIQLCIVLLCAGLLVTTLTNIQGIVLGVTHKKANASNSVSYDITKIVEHAGYTKGYADYWLSPISTYLSNNKVHFMQVVCTDGVLSPYKWLVNYSDFSTKASKTFYVLDPSLTDPAVCSLEKISRHYGQPENILNYRGRSILLFNRDLLSTH